MLSVLNKQKQLKALQITVLQKTGILTTNEDGVIIRTPSTFETEAFKEYQELEERIINYKYASSYSLREQVNLQLEQEIQEYATQLKQLKYDLDSLEMISDFLSLYPEMEQFIYE
jgi:predicted house-cleaning noncanonical NTP pyrophosphatase (MazG superfamily)